MHRNSVARSNLWIGFGMNDTCFISMSATVDLSITSGQGSCKMFAGPILISMSTMVLGRPPAARCRCSGQPASFESVSTRSPERSISG